jgi:hypothetical protein
MVLCSQANRSDGHGWEMRCLRIEDELFAGQDGDAPAYTRRDAITDEGLACEMTSTRSQKVAPSITFGN